MHTQDNGTKVPYRAPFFRGSTTHSKVKEWIGLMMRRKAIQCKPADQQYLRLVKGAVSFLSWIQRQLCIFALRRSFGRVKIVIVRQLGASGSHACIAKQRRIEWSRWYKVDMDSMPVAGRVSMGESTVHILSHQIERTGKARVTMPKVTCTT